TLLAGAARAGSLAAAGCCAAGDPSSAQDTAAASVSDADLQKALDEGGTITVWAWEPTLDKVVTDFQAEYPKVKVDLVNAGTGNDQYTALQNAIKAGTGVPDVAKIED